MEQSPTKLDYYENMTKLQSQASILSSFKVCFKTFHDLGLIVSALFASRENGGIF